MDIADKKFGQAINHWASQSINQGT